MFVNYSSRFKTEIGNMYFIVIIILFNSTIILIKSCKNWLMIF